MSFTFTGLESFFMTVESDVIKTIVNIQQGLGAAMHEVQSGLDWVASNAPHAAAIARQMASVGALAAPEIGVLNPGAGSVLTGGVAALNLAADALDSFSSQMAANKANGVVQADASALLAAYHTYKSTQSASAQMGVALATPLAAPAK